MDGVDRRKHVEKRTIGIGVEIESFRSQLQPCHVLAGYERQSQSKSGPDPPHGLRSGYSLKAYVARDFLPRDFKRQTA